MDNDPYPPVADQCASPNDTAVCITDGQVQASSTASPATAGPAGCTTSGTCSCRPDVDECITAGVCGTNAFGGITRSSTSATAHDLRHNDRPHHRDVVAPGADPQGYPDAEATIDIAVHETDEAMTDPEGIGCMDPNGFEVGDKCEFGPQRGTRSGSRRTGRRSTRSSTAMSTCSRRCGQTTTTQQSTAFSATTTATRCRCRRSTSRSSAPIVSGNIESPRRASASR